ncbi:MAG: prohibitin family protein, partial [Shewanella sp.]
MINSDVKILSSATLTKIIPLGILLILLISLFGSWYTVDQGERGVILRNGKIIG